MRSSKFFGYVNRAFQKSPLLKRFLRAQIAFSLFVGYQTEPFLNVDGYSKCLCKLTWMVVVLFFSMVGFPPFNVVPTVHVVHSMYRVVIMPLKTSYVRFLPVL